MKSKAIDAATLHTPALGAIYFWTMRQYDIIKVFCKALGLYFATQAFVNVKEITYYSILTEFYDNDNTRLYSFLGGQFIILLFNIITAWVLIKKADFIAGKIITDTNDKLELNVKKTDLIELVIIGISGLLIIESTPELINKLVNYVYLNPYDRAEKSEFWTSNNKANILYSIFKLAVGLVTITNSRLISRRLTKIGDKDELGENENK